MSVTNDLVMDRWCERVRTGKDPLSKQGFALSTEGRNLLSRGDTLYSYGTHFVLAWAVRDKRGQVMYLILNGDTYSNTTSKHQSWARGVCERLGTTLGVPVILLPFSALAAAGVSPDALEPIDVRDDRHVANQHSSRTKPGTRHPTIPCPLGTMKVKLRYAHGTLDRRTGALYESPTSYGPHACDQWREWPQDASVPEDAIVHNEQPFPAQPSILADREAWNGWSEQYANHSTGQVPERVALQVPDPDRVFVGRNSWLTAQFDGEVWRWETTTHFLGDSLFRARLRESVNVKPTAEQLAAHAQWQRAANDRQRSGEYVRTELALAGRWERSCNVPRSPEMIESLKRQLAFMADRHESATEALYALIPPGHSTSRRDTGEALRISRQRTRHAYFVSSFDYQEARPLYFLCELPARARPQTVDEAIEALKPPEVVAALARGLTVTRQGDLFAIPTKLGKRQLRRMLRRGGDFEKRLRILGTNHAVTEGALCKGGAVLGRGTMYHEPDAWRQPDHARKRLGDGKAWHLLVRNTVPRH